MVDVWNGGTPTYAKPPNVAATYRDAKWQKYLTNLWLNVKPAAPPVLRPLSLPELERAAPRRGGASEHHARLHARNNSTPGRTASHPAEGRAMATEMLGSASEPTERRDRARAAVQRESIAVVRGAWPGCSLPRPFSDCARPVPDGRPDLAAAAHSGFLHRQRAPSARRDSAEDEPGLAVECPPDQRGMVGTAPALSDRDRLRGRDDGGISHAALHGVLLAPLLLDAGPRPVRPVLRRPDAPGLPLLGDLPAAERPLVARCGAQPRSASSSTSANSHGLLRRSSCRCASSTGSPRS